jgi:hypothetical protein
VPPCSPALPWVDNHTSRFRQHRCNSRRIVPLFLLSA